MLCDRCATNGKCPQFQAGSECPPEKKVFNRLVKDLSKQYALDTLADKILAERAAMYLIRISHVEKHESSVGVSQKSILYGTHINRLDNTLRGLLNDLAISRVRRKGLEKTKQLMINIEDLLQRLANKEQTKTRRTFSRFNRDNRSLRRPITIYHILLANWKMECQTFLQRKKRTTPRQQ